MNPHGTSRAALALLVSLGLAIPPLRAENAPPAPPLAKSVEVVVTNVDVVVTDKKGNPITDLKPEDFVLKEDGVAQALTHMALVDNGGPAPAAPAGQPEKLEGPALPPVPKVHLVVFIDQVHLTAGNRNRALQSLAEFLPKAVGPRVEAQVVTWNRALQTRGPFTSDGDLLTALLRSLKKESAWGDLPVRERNGLYSEIDAAFVAPAQTNGKRPDTQDLRDALIPAAASHVRIWCDQQIHDADGTLGAVRSSVAALAGVEGRKLIFLVTEGLTATPGRELFDYFRNAALNSGPATPGLALADVSSMNYTNYDTSTAFKELTRISNASGVSLVAIEASGLTFDASMSAEFAGTLGRANDGLAKLDADSALLYLADQTGGAAVIGRNNLVTALNALEAGWRSYYSLGFESSNAKPGRERSLSVTVKRPGAIVRSRRSLVERTWEQKIADAVLSGIYLPRTHNPLGATLNVGLPVRSGKLFVVPLEFLIPFENLALIPNGKLARGRILLTVAAVSADGQTSEISTQRAPIEVPETELENTQGKPFVYTTTLKLRPGPQIVSLALTDEVTQITSYVQPGLVISDRDRDGNPRKP